MVHLYLIPVPLSEVADTSFVSPFMLEIIHNLPLLIVEDERTARRHLRRMGYKKNFDQIEMVVLNEHSSTEVVSDLLKMVMEKGAAGLMSEAGMPGIADPGEELIRLAHREKIVVHPLIGPSSLFLALAASGLNAEGFTFHGYISAKQIERKTQIRELEKKVQTSGQTQIFIETPYRNHAVLMDLLDILASGTSLCIACDICTANEMIETKSVQEWKKKPPEINKRLCVFLIGR